MVSHSGKAKMLEASLILLLSNISFVGKCVTRPIHCRDGLSTQEGSTREIIECSIKMSLFEKKIEKLTYIDGFPPGNSENAGGFAHIALIKYFICG